MLETRILAESVSRDTIRKVNFLTGNPDPGTYIVGMKLSAISAKTPMIEVQIEVSENRKIISCKRVYD